MPVPGGWGGLVRHQMPGAWCIPAPAAEGHSPGPPRLSRWGRAPRASCARVEDTVRLSAAPFAATPASSPDLGGCCKESNFFPVPRDWKNEWFQTVRRHGALLAPLHLHRANHRGDALGQLSPQAVGMAGELPVRSWAPAAPPCWVGGAAGWGRA